MAKEIYGARLNEVGGEQKLQSYKKILGEMKMVLDASWPSSWKEAVDYIGQYIKENDSKQLIQKNGGVSNTAENISELIALFQDALADVTIEDMTRKKLVEEINEIGAKYTEDASVGHPDSKNSSSVPPTVAPLGHSSLFARRKKQERLTDVTTESLFSHNQCLTSIAG